MNLSTGTERNIMQSEGRLPFLRGTSTHKAGAATNKALGVLF